MVLSLSALFSPPSIHVCPLLHSRINLCKPRQSVLDVDFLHRGRFQRPDIVQRAHLNNHDARLWCPGLCGMRLAIYGAATVRAESCRELKPFVKVPGSDLLQFSFLDGEGSYGNDEVERPRGPGDLAARPTVTDRGLWEILGVGQSVSPSWRSLAPF
jgi:hypothetical protein